MTHGFLGYDASLMLDVVVTALILIVPVLAYSLYAVKVRRAYRLHRNLQIGLGLVLLIAVTAFEVDMRLHGGWKQIVNKQADVPRVSPEAMEVIGQILTVHLIFAISTPFLWAATLYLAWKRFGNPVQPGPHSRLHKTLGWASVIDIVLTSLTGLWFYYAAFVATA